MTTDETLRARVVQLEAALRPVAALLDGYDGHGTLRDGQWCEAMLRMGDVRRACAALSGTPAPSPDPTRYDVRWPPDLRVEAPWAGSPAPSPCPVCKGTGWETFVTGAAGRGAERRELCGDCKGSGRVEAPTPYRPGPGESARIDGRQVGAAEGAPVRWTVAPPMGGDPCAPIHWVKHGPEVLVGGVGEVRPAPSPALVEAPITDDVMRAAVRAIKRRFLGWRIPPVELPAESVIEETVREVAQIVGATALVEAVKAAHEEGARQALVEAVRAVERGAEKIDCLIRVRALSPEAIARRIGGGR